VIGSKQRPILDHTQHAQQIDIHAPGEIRTQNSKKRAFVDLRLRERGRWDRLFSDYTWTLWSCGRRTTRWERRSTYDHANL